jgi:chemotaxis protein methyltransferase CheR
VAASCQGALSPTQILHPAEFKKISQLAYDHFGLDLHEGKQSLVAMRLGKLLHELGLKSFQDYYEYVMADRSGAALASMVDQLTTNHTGFFREAKHFEFLRNTVFPTLLARSQVHIWSAACSTGEEPYSIAISLLEESQQVAATKVRIKATDISMRALMKGMRGIYPADRFKEIPFTLLQRYLLKSRNAAGDLFRFKSSVRSMIDFEHLNLMQELPEHYRCSVIFCRNIMIYFDRPTQQNLVQRLSKHLEDGGYLFIGHSESLNNISHSLDYVSPTIFRKAGRARNDQIGGE